MRTFGHLQRRSGYRGQGAGGQAGGYASEPAGDGQGFWTPQERSAEETRRRTAQADAAATALTAMNAKIAAIRADGTKTAQQKLIALRALSASGYSREEFDVLHEAQATG